MKIFSLSKNTKSALFVFIIAFSSFLAFEPLFEYLGQKAAQEFAAAIFGTIFAAVITMVLLNKQTETEEEKERNSKVFEQKIILYNEVIDKLQNIFEKSVDNQLQMSRKEIIQMEFLLAKMILVGSDKTINEFKKFYLTVIHSYSGETQTLHLSSSDKQIVFRFADYCREELGLSNKNIEQEVLEDIILQSELFNRLEKKENLSPETISIIKRIYGYIVFDLDVHNRKIKFLKNGFEAYGDFNHECYFLKCYIEPQKVILILNDEYRITEFKTEAVNGEIALIIRSSEIKNNNLYFNKIEKIIHDSYLKAGEF